MIRSIAILSSGTSDTNPKLVFMTKITLLAPSFLYAFMSAMRQIGRIDGTFCKVNTNGLIVFSRFNIMQTGKYLFKFQYLLGLYKGVTVKLLYLMYHII